MPAAPKASTSTMKAPKVKGAVRAKSGCYTCRIRRKKCDERPDEHGQCETCVRLRLQCLGFGAKRPDWLRESSNVTDLRDKIKTFLASQGMIKGHSGPSQRPATNRPEEPQEERAMLRLDTEGQFPKTGSESPPAGNLLVLNTDDVRHTQVSNVRGGTEDGAWNPNFEPNSILHHPSQPPQALRQDSPSFAYQGAPATQQTQQIDPSLMSQTHDANTTLPTSSWTSHPNRTPVDLTLVPTRASGFGQSYNWASDGEELYGMGFDGVNSASISPFSPMIHTHGANDEWILTYLQTVMDKQYQLANTPISEVLRLTLESGSGIARSSASLLASVYYQRKMHGGHFPALHDISIRERYTQLETVLKKEHHDNNDAVGALNVISVFLFDGGSGNWSEWLELAVNHSRRILTNQRRSGRFINYRDALLHCTGLEQFIVKTTLWFDVLASVTTMVEPMLLDVIRELFDPTRGGVFEAAEDSDALSMMAIMGCEGRVIWAIAQISVLSKQKRALMNTGMLDTVSLVNRCNEIEAVLGPPEPLSVDREEVHRKLTSEVFRHAARLYLFTVLHGDYPRVQPLRGAVDEMISLLTTSYRKQRGHIGQIVIRSTVFAVCMAACLCVNRETQIGLFKNLDLENDGEAYGNFKGVSQVVEEVWRQRDQSESKDPVPWRQILHKTRLLLV